MDGGFSKGKIFLLCHSLAMYKVDQKEAPHCVMEKSLKLIMLSYFACMMQNGTENEGSGMV